jgi:cytochrome c oxidase accessory protein FixG
MANDKEPKVIPIEASAAATPQQTSLYESQPKIYPRSVKGRFATWRWIFVWLTQIVFYGLPWMSWNDRQAVVFDLAARKFYLFGLVLWPQDFIYLTGLLIVCALSLFLFTAVAGRVWCGYACPQTVYTELFLWIEKVCEGDRQARIKLDAAPWSLRKLLRKGGKQLGWIGLSLWTGYTFVGYFTPIRVLASELAALSLGPWETFWVLFYGFATYSNAGYLREQICKLMCPYARFQGAMFDKDTLIITYDQLRGEPRRPRARKQEGLEPAGDCVACSLCVQVCPTGIDIRDGLQVGCIGCAACIDVCDTVMDKIGSPRGLIRYSTERAMAERSNSTVSILRRLMRPRVILYSIILVLLSSALMFSLIWLRKPFKADIIRDRGALARVVERGYVENTYRLQLMNTTEQAQRYHFDVSGLPGLSLTSEADISVPATDSRAVAVRLQVPPDSVPPGSHAIRFHIRAIAPEGEQGAEIEERAVFLMPM